MRGGESWIRSFVWMFFVGRTTTFICEELYINGTAAQVLQKIYKERLTVAWVALIIITR